MSSENEKSSRRLMTEEPHDSAAFLKKMGHQLVHCLFAASKTVQIHKLDNRATKQALGELRGVIGEIAAKEGRVQLKMAAEYLLLNEHRIVVDSQHFGPFLYLMDEMKSRQVETIEFDSAVGEDQLGAFLHTFYSVEPGEDCFARLDRGLKQNGVTEVEVSELVEKERHLRDYDATPRNMILESNRVFFRAVALMREIVRAIEERHSINVRKAKRLTQQMVDIIQTDESILMGISSIKNFDEYTFAHSVNVCILSMAIADRLRLLKSDIARLGLAALFHDIGKVYIPASILNNPNRLKGRDWELMKYHTFFGVKELCNVKALREISDALFVAIQHHVHYNMNGYPYKSRGWDLKLFSRIVTVADYYDAMTSPRIYRLEPLRPDKVLRFVLLKSGTIFDPFLAKVFLNIMGIYPVGTAVELEGGHKAVVIRQNRESRYLHRPVVKLVEGQEKGRELDLSARDDQGRYLSGIVGVVEEGADEMRSEVFLSQEQ